MNKQEYESWLEETAKSVGAWRVDEVTWANSGTILAYHGAPPAGATGRYVEIEHNGRLSVGTYADAIPHIGEACFTEIGAIQYQDFATAWKAARYARFGPFLPVPGILAVMSKPHGGA